MGSIIDFTTKLIVAPTGTFSLPIDKLRGAAEHLKLFHVVYKRGVYQVTKKTLAVDLIGEMEKKGGGTLKSPVHMISNKNYTVIIDNENIYYITLPERILHHIVFMEDEQED